MNIIALYILVLLYKYVDACVNVSNTVSIIKKIEMYSYILNLLYIYKKVIIMTDTKMKRQLLITIKMNNIHITYTYT